MVCFHMEATLRSLASHVLQLKVDGNLGLDFVQSCGTCLLRYSSSSNNYGFYGFVVQAVACCP